MLFRSRFVGSAESDGAALGREPRKASTPCDSRVCCIAESQSRLLVREMGPIERRRAGESWRGLAVVDDGTDTDQAAKGTSSALTDMMWVGVCSGSVL